MSTNQVSNICSSKDCNKIISRKAIIFGCINCKTCRRKIGTLKQRQPICGYRNKYGDVCKHDYLLEYHAHCDNESCAGEILCELCGQCPICDPCI